jgi:hypothetical protein
MTPSSDPDERISRLRVGIKHKRCIGRLRGVAVTGSSSEIAGASFRASVSFLRPPFHPGRRDCPGLVGDSRFPLGVFQSLHLAGLTGAQENGT